ncbi:DUF5320 family protein [Chloroflexota bacterium]
MPEYDGTGPMGMGPMTGGGMGFCAVPISPKWPINHGIGFPMPYAAPSGIPYYGVPSFAPEIAWGEDLGYLKALAQSMREDLQETEAKTKQIESKKD